MQFPEFLIPVIDEILANITSTNVMTTFNLTSDYFQIAIDPGDITKTAFIARNGCFSFKRMSFGLAGLPSMFQKALSTILGPLLGIYLYDIIVMATTFE